jgi:membrane protease YdiL (CAAX protease family)
VALNRGDLSSLGFLARPGQGWRWWILTSLKLGAFVVFCLVLGLGIWVGIGNDLPIYTTPPTQFLANFLHMCFVAPVMEETIYRAIVCVPLVAAIGCWRTIAVCGVLFAGLHVAYGNPSPENLVGGFLLVWVYLKSETILLPVLLHSLGNFVVLISQVAGWYLLA